MGRLCTLIHIFHCLATSHIYSLHLLIWPALACPSVTSYSTHSPRFQIIFLKNIKCRDKILVNFRVPLRKGITIRVLSAVLVCGSKAIHHTPHTNNWLYLLKNPMNTKKNGIRKGIVNFQS